MAKVQQSSTWIRAPKGAARKGGGEREVRRIFKMLRDMAKHWAGKDRHP